MIRHLSEPVLRQTRGSTLVYEPVPLPTDPPEAFERYMRQWGRPIGHAPGETVKLSLELHLEYDAIGFPRVGGLIAAAIQVIRDAQDPGAA